MSTKTTPMQNFIIVVPYYPFSTRAITTRLKVDKLCFWYNSNLEHPVTDEIIRLFIKHAGLYKPSIFPDHPELGCYAMDNHITYENGETLVHEIYYKKELIYRRG